MNQSILVAVLAAGAVACSWAVFYFSKLLPRAEFKGRGQRHCERRFVTNAFGAISG